LNLFFLFFWLVCRRKFVWLPNCRSLLWKT
jgi:hypothetical protein